MEKIHLKTLVSTLVSLYNKGVDYIDFIKQENEDGSTSLMIYFSEEYMSDDTPRKKMGNDDDDLKDLIV